MDVYNGGEITIHKYYDYRAASGYFQAPALYLWQKPGPTF
jgi:hypothetical protein